MATVTISIRIDEETLKALGADAKAQDRKRNNHINHIIKEHLRKVEGGKCHELD